MRYIMMIAVILTLLLIASASINSTLSSLQQEFSIQNTANILIQDDFANTTSLPRLEVSRNKIVFQSNQSQIWLKGVDYAGGDWWYGLDGTKVSEAQYDYMKNWKLNIVRIGIYPKGWTEDWYDSQLGYFRDVITSMVEWGAQRGIYSILIYSTVSVDVSTWTNTDWDNWVAWWQSVATHFKGSTNVIYTLIGEPNKISASLHQTKMQQAIDAIRAIDSDVIISLNEISENTWADIGLKYEQTHPINRPNLIFTPHTYYHNDVNDYSKDAIRSLARSRGWKWAVDNGRAVVLEEFNYNHTDASTNGPQWMRNIMEVMNEDGYSGFLGFWWSTRSPWQLLADNNGNNETAGSVLREYLES